MNPLHLSNPKIRYVYLVQDASDVIRMGGTALNVYSTFQTAYDAANTLQTSNGGIVIIKVGNITAAVSGNLTLLADYNSNIHINGLNSVDSNLGNIIADNAAGTAFSVNINANNVLIGNITSNATTASGSGGLIIIRGNDLSINAVTSTALGNNDAGTIQIIADTVGGIRLNGSITAQGSGAGAGSEGAVIISKAMAVVPITVNNIGGTTGSGGRITIISTLFALDSSNPSIAGLSVQMTKNGAGGATDLLNIVDSVINNITQTNNSASNFGIVNITNTEITGIYTRLATSTGGWGTSTLKNLKYTSTTATNGLSFTTAATTSNLIGTMTMEDCTIDAGRINIVHSGASGSMGTLTINDSVVQGDTVITYGNAVTTPATYTWSRNRFGGNLTITASGSNILNSYNLIECVLNTSPVTSTTFQQTGTATSANAVQFNSCRCGQVNLTTTNTGTPVINTLSESNIAQIISNTVGTTANGNNLLLNNTVVVASVIQRLTNQDGTSTGNYGSITLINSMTGPNGDITINDSTNPSGSTGAKVVSLTNSKIGTMNLGTAVNGTQPLTVLCNTSTIFNNITASQTGSPAGNTITLNDTTILDNNSGNSIHIDTPGDIVFTINNSVLKTNLFTSGTNIVTINASNSEINEAQQMAKGIFNSVQMGTSSTPSNCIHNIYGNATGFNTGCEFYDCIFNANTNTIASTGGAVIIQKNNLHRTTPVANNVVNFIPTYTTADLTGSSLTITYIGSFLEKALLSGFTGETIDTVVGIAENNEVEFLLDAGTVVFSDTPIGTPIAVNQIALEGTPTITLTGQSIGGRAGAGSDFLVLRKDGDNTSGINRQTDASVLIP